MRPDEEFADSLKLVAIACVAAVLTATVVIGAGQALMQDPQVPAAPDQGGLIRIAAR